MYTKKALPLGAALGRLKRHLSLTSATQVKQPGKWLAGSAIMAGSASAGFVLSKDEQQQIVQEVKIDHPCVSRSITKREPQLPIPQLTELELKQRREKLPMMTLDQVREDHGPGVVWVTREGGVYDVTPFMEAHPGGSARIEMVNGSDLSAYWSVYDLHMRPHILQLIEEYRVGNLPPEETARAKKEAEGEFSSYYTDDPARPRAAAGDLRIASTHPWNHEPLLHHLTESYFTPNDLFFVRNHNSVPNIDVEEWALQIEANPECGLQQVSFTYEDLKTKFPRVEVVSTLQCAGNRQEEFIEKDRPLYVAPHWRGGAIGCAKWAGVRVRDLLGAAGLDVDGMALGKVTNPKAKIVNFEAEDADETGTAYAGVIPVGKAIDPFGDAILAYEMNGETLPRDHGYPVRLIAPGTGGCRNVKWVKNISVTEMPSELDSGSKLDRHFSPEVSWTAHRKHCAQDLPATKNWKPPVSMGSGDNCEIRLDQGPVIQSLPVQSVLCWPPNKSEISGQVGEIEVKGVAYSGGGRGICRVEVSLDGGENFYAADLTLAPNDENRPPPEYGIGRNWGWALFSKKVPLPENVKGKLAKGEKVELEVCCKAVDGDFNTQPENMHTSWNVLGICVNHWPKTTVTLNPGLPKTHLPTIPATPPPGSCEWPAAAASSGCPVRLPMK